jgi:glycosyltransferase involved in cell wall biosynthesis
MNIQHVLHPTVHLNLNVPGGVERVAIEEVTRLNQSGYRARLTAVRITGQVPFARCVRAPQKRTRVGSLPYYMTVLCMSATADIVHAHYGPMFASLAPKRTLVHLHGLGVAVPPERSWWLRRARRAKWIAVSRHVAGAFASVFPPPVPEVTVLPNGVEIELFSPGEPPEADTPVRVVFAGRWVRRKGVSVLLDAVRRLNENELNVRAVIAGGGGLGGEPDDKHVRVAVKAAITDGIAEVHGLLEHAELARLYRSAHIGVVPSTFEEPFGLVSAEMGACGLPVVASRIGGLPEIVIHGKTGLLVTSGDAAELAQAIRLLIGNEELRSKMGRNARKHVVGNFSWERHIKHLGLIYKEIADRVRHESP